MEQPLDIARVVRMTGLTARALRFYEGRGLVRPLRTASGRRLYGAGELRRLNQIVALKAAGFALADIGRLLDRRPIDLGRLLDAQIEALAAQGRRIADAHRLLLAAKSRVDRGEPLDAATLCSLIRTGSHVMNDENWKTVTDRYVDPENRGDWAASYARMPADFDQADYSARWAGLVARIEAALPLDPASAPAQALYGEWQALLAPFTAIATPGMKADVTRLYDDIDAWKDERTPPFPAEVWRFINAAGAARKAA